MKSFTDLKDISPHYGAYEKYSNQISAIVKSFLDFAYVIDIEDFDRCIPGSIRDGHEDAKEQVMRDGILYCKEKTDRFDEICQFFQKQFRGDVVNDLEFDIRTANDKQTISLGFAENFRFKSINSGFNIFNLQKQQRDCIIPQDDNSVIFCADFRQFEFRTFLNIQGLCHYLKSEDLYNELGKELNLQAEDLKVNIISYLYGYNKDPRLEEFFQKESLLNRIQNDIFEFEGKLVYVPATDTDGKKIHTITQTLSYFVYVQKLRKILDLLKTKQSKFIFPLHDSVIISLNRDEPEILNQIVDVLEDDVYKIKMYMGDNFRDIEEL